MNLRSRQIVMFLLPLALVLLLGPRFWTGTVQAQDPRDPSAFAPPRDELPVTPPEDAIVLFGGDGTNQFLSMEGGPINWPHEDGALVSSRGQRRTNHLVSRWHFRDADIHVEFMLPEKTSGNSGVYVHGNYELQIFNSFGKEHPEMGDMGAIYGFAKPLTNACRKPGEWQVYDIRYRAPRRNVDGNIHQEGSMTAFLNGVRVQDNTTFGEPKSRWHPYRYGTTPYLQKIWQRQQRTGVGPVFLQDHDSPVRFRNVWIRPLDDQAFLYEPVSEPSVEPTGFRSAQPIWPPGRSEEMNLTVGYRAVIPRPDSGKTLLRIAASSIYRVRVNGAFLACGPARGPHGFFRIDEWDVSDQLDADANVVAVEVAGYNANSYYLLDQPSFLQVEVTNGSRVLASTAGSGVPFSARILDERLQKVQRYSFQRPFIEVYRLEPGFDRWVREPEEPASEVKTQIQAPKNLLPRRVLYPTFTLQKPTRWGPRGKIELLEEVPRLWKDRSLANIGPELKGFPEDQLVVIPTIEAQHHRTVPQSNDWRAYDKRASIELRETTYHIVDLGTNFSGFLGARVQCAKPTRLWLVFDEILGEDGDVNFRRLGCANIIDYTLEPGTYELESIEPYTARYVKLVCLKGACSVRDLFCREYAYPEVTQATFHASDERLNKLFAAGVETFRQNSLDIFMDCPSRERAGWLCDSFFTARVEYDLADAMRVERNFVENFLLPERFQHLPDGVFPMCYPADHPNGNFIPNWAMWFVVQLEEYMGRSGDRETIDAARPKIMRLLDYFRQFENSDGLLEKLERWVFVEWSAANQFVQDVNYPSNMLYAGTLSAAGRMYKMPELLAKADAIRDMIRKQSFDGEFFVDNAVREDGQLEVTRNRSEVCQYFAFFFQVATPEVHGELWKRLLDEFGPERKENQAFAEVHLANSFIGNMLRMELLSRAGRNQQILDESIAYLLYMADRTGTLWEHTGAYASCNHGFASHIVHTLYRDVLGLYEVDSVNRQVRIRFGDLQLTRCSGSMPTPHGAVSLDWNKEGKRLNYRLVVPSDYSVKVDNQSGCQLAPIPE